MMVIYSTTAQDQKVMDALEKLRLAFLDSGDLQASSIVGELFSHIDPSYCECNHCEHCQGILEDGQRDDNCDCSRCRKCELILQGLSDEDCDCKRCPHCKRLFVPPQEAGE